MPLECILRRPKTDLTMISVLLLVLYKTTGRLWRNRLSMLFRNYRGFSNSGSIGIHEVDQSVFDLGGGILQSARFVRPLLSIYSLVSYLVDI